MVVPRNHPEDKQHPLEERTAELRADLRSMDPHLLAERTGSEYRAKSEGKGEFRLDVWGKRTILKTPTFIAQNPQTGQPLDTFSQALLAYYFRTSDGTPQSGRYVAFTELPDGQFYTQAFQGYTGGELARTFRNELADFVGAAEHLGGRRELLGNAAYSYQVLPRVSIMVVCWLGDEDFPPSYRILFDSAVSRHLPTDACAILGSTLTRQLIKVHQEAQDVV